MKILILCTGNSCRSQMSHGFLQSFNKDLEVHSAGTKPAECINPKAVEVMSEVGIDISKHKPKSVETYLNDEWDYVITVCGGANESCPMFVGNVKHRLHIGFDDPSCAVGTDEFVMSEFRRVRNEIKHRFAEFFITQILKREIPKDLAALLGVQRAQVSKIESDRNITFTTICRVFRAMDIKANQDLVGLGKVVLW